MSAALLEARCRGSECCGGAGGASSGVLVEGGLELCAVAASMVAYLAAQLCDVRLFHFWKRLTKGKHLWLRNNASTMVSQIVDTTAVILVTHFYAAALPVNADEPIWPQLMVFIASGYVFKLLVAALDTGPIYLAVRYLRPWLGLKENEEAIG